MHLMLSAGLNVSHLICSCVTHEKPYFSYPKIRNVEILGVRKGDEFVRRLAGYLKKEEIKALVFPGDNMTHSLMIIEACRRASCHAIPQYHGSPYAYLKKYITMSDIREKPILALRLLWSKIIYPLKKRKLLRYINSPCSKIVTVSKGSSDELKQLHGKESPLREKLITIYNPLSFQINNITLDVEKKQ